MTNKIQKIREGIEKLKSNLVYGACSSQVAMETRCKEEAYNEVLAILDTMQEQHVKESAEIQHEDKSCEDNGNSLTKEPTSWLDEFRAKLDSLSKEEFEQLWGKYGAEEKEELVSSIWHDASEKSNEPEDVVIIDPSDNTGEVLTNCTDVYSGRIWSYTSDLLNLDNPCKIGKNLQEEPVSKQKLSNVQRTGKNWKEPVSEEWIEELRTKLDSMSKEDFKKVFDKYAIDFDEEPVSEDLEKASNSYVLNVRKGYPRVMDETDRYICNAFKAGANWQKEHLMKDAVDGEIGYWNLRWLSVNADLPRTVEEGDKVKVILIKEK